MSKRVSLSLAVFCLLVVTPLVGQAQQQEAPVFTYVAEWSVPRDKWGDFTASFEKDSRPILERMTASGTLVDWGSFSTVVHLPNEATHGIWWSSTSQAGIEHTRQELLKLAPNPAQLAATMHRDYYLRSLTHQAKATSTGAVSGYLVASSSQVQPGKGQEWRDLWNKYSKPTYDELLGNGSILYYALQVEQVHTDNPGVRYVVLITPNAEGLDKVNEAFRALSEKRGPVENRSIGAAFADVTVAGAHRDFFAQVLSYMHK